MIKSDAPISNLKEDEFQRDSFAKQISDLIINRESNDSFVIGIYGKWGEGKSSTINLIKNKLEQEKDKTIILPFNPWMFSNEGDLLTVFFKTIINLFKNTPISIKNKLGKKLDQYSDIIGGAALTLFSIPGISNITSKVGKYLSQKSLDERKIEINEALSTFDKKVVVILDDIDRLSPNEIIAVFKLIKLTGDFKNFIYIVAFDNILVGKLISKHFEGEGDGYLEKIIQLPLKLPKAPKHLILKQLTNSIDEILKTNKVVLSNDERYRLDSALTMFIAPCIDTPRIEIRYINSLNFTIPLLLNEVNVIDLILIEWIKVYYPEWYTFIRDESNYFFYNKKSKDLFLSKIKIKEENIKSEIENKISNICESSESMEILKRISIELFPHLKQTLDTSLNSNIDAQQLIKEQRISSHDYFERYFTYTVIKGQISDVKYNSFLNEMFKDYGISDKKKLTEFIDNTEIENLTFKLQISFKDINLESIKPFVLNLAYLSDRFPYPKEIFSLYGPLRTIGTIITELIRELDKSDRLELALKIFKVSSSLELSWELWYNFHPKISESFVSELFNKIEYDEISKVLFEDTKSKLDFENALNSFYSKYCKEYFQLWGKYNNKEINKLTLDSINQNINNLVKIIKVYGSTGHSTSHTGPYTSEFTSTQMKELSKIMDTNKVYHLSIKLHGHRDIPVSSNDREPLSDGDLIGIFQQYEKTKISKNKL